MSQIPMLALSAKSRWRAGLLLLVLACLGVTARGFKSERGYLWSRDFKPLYAGARCLLDNRNPYDNEALKLEYTQAGGSLDDLRPFEPFYALYPPPAFLFVLPFALLPWQAAHLAFLAVSAAVFCGGGLLVAWFCREKSPLLIPILIGIFLIGANILMMLAQPAMLAIGLCMIAVVLLLEGKYPALAVFCFALSLALKPQTGAMVWLFFLVSRKYRPKAIVVFALTLLLCVPGIVWAAVTPASAHWVHDLRVNLKGTEQPGSISDPGPADPEAYNMTTLQTVFSLVRDDKHFYNAASWAISGVLLLLILSASRRRGLSEEEELFAIAALTCLSMLPFYHRVYDARLLLLCFPALAIVLQRATARMFAFSKSWGNAQSSGYAALGWAALTIALCALIENDRYSIRLYALMDGPDPQHIFMSIVLLRSYPLILLAQAVLYLALLLYSGSERARQSRESVAAAAVSSGVVHS